ncbi:MAG: CPBP family intramembrane metalloprotease [Planctomycetia bacterium]|nr:CPBP family intramembrane metalloprotease [Planctomycetia bacterium]
MDTMTSFVAGFFKRETAKPVLILFYAIVALVAWKAIPLTPPFAPEVNATSDGPLSLWGFLHGEQRILAALVLMGIIPACLVRFVLRERLADYGVSLGVPIRTVRTMLMTVPFFAVGGWLSAGNDVFLGTAPFCSCRPLTGWYIPAHLCCYFVFYYASWEFFFRGFLMKGLAPSCGLAPALLIQTMAATLVHIGHPQIEIVSCIAASLFWGFIALRTRSLISGTVQHATLGVLLDYFIIRRFM